jgi:hypothetical protein
VTAALTSAPATVPGPPFLGPATTFAGRLGRVHGQGAVRGCAGGVVAGLLGRGLGLVPGRMVAARLDIEPSAAGDRWTRRFGRRTWTSTCQRTADGIVEWVGPRARGPAGRGLVGLDLAVAIAGDHATLRLRGVWLGSRWLGRVPGLRVDADIDARDGGLCFRPVVSFAGRVLVAYEGWIR